MFQLKKLQEVAKTEESVDKKEVNLTLLPPEHPQLLRRVGSDGLLVSWTPPEDDEVTGYLVRRRLSRLQTLLIRFADLRQLGADSEG